MGDVGCGMWEERGERREEMHSKLHITYMAIVKYHNHITYIAITITIRASHTKESLVPIPKQHSIIPIPNSSTVP